MTADICVMVPTIRNHECMRSYFQNARDHGFDLDRLFVVLITEDFCDTDAMEQMLDEEGVDGAVYDGTAREAWFETHGAGEYSHLIPEASHAQTSFGLLYMWANDYEYGVFIDDDTLPHEDADFFGTHMENLAYEGEIETVSSDEQWVNVLYQNEDEHGLYPRGYPYAAMDEAVETETTEVDDVVASQGLWTNVPDLDAVRILMDGDLQGQAQTRTTAADFGEDFVAAEGQYLTVCSMNLAFRREVIPAFYQLPMDDNEWDVGRFDDIWSGVFLKRACDVLGKQIYNGDPLCEHNKAPRSTFSDLTNEVHGLELNEHVWEIVDEAGADADSYAEVFDAIGTAMADGDFSDWENGAFLNYCGEFMLDWLECLDELDDAATEQVPATADD
ncbi:alpha-1 4-glucan-protein synthase [Haloarcula rubripromontorii]|uniref:Alpha-1 4-glucan-protein synthase n=1 Tax=Haloarcula rubripromontorii TaxID=1705562 RepID=A0A0N0BNV9_9EURY|nr:alpha-1 4-glucan-protein synthase [Haloarcula rubripromontorii]KOX93066.1 alpha-1 4-glucan-protein synthase [Haloarcula rubripromontorii]NLV06585.1 alpha-1 4-glucan-protein synthase [Haloarcula rubripromontorii]